MIGTGQDWIDGEFRGFAKKYQVFERVGLVERQVAAGKPQGSFLPLVVRGNLFRCEAVGSKEKSLSK